MLDPKLGLPLALGPALAWLGAWPHFRRSVPGQLPVLLAVLATAYATGAAVEPEFRADAPSYYSYLRSAFFDHDLDFANERRRWGFPEESLTSTGLRLNQHSVGPALWWSPFFLFAHVYVRSGSAFGLLDYEPDGYSVPYLRATAMGTVTIGLLGAWLLGRTLSRRFQPALAALAVTACVLGSSTVYYLFVQPTMAHGLVFGFACFTFWALEHTQREPSAWSWAVLGALLGALSITRWQCAVTGLAALVVAASHVRQGRLRTRWLLGAGCAGLLVITPQLLAWKALYGTYLTVPQPRSFFLGAPVRALDVLLHADHGLFVWTPLMLLAVLGLLLSLRHWPSLALAGWLVFAASVAVNGSISDWAGSDSFGSRRFDLVGPFFALGLCSLFMATMRSRWLAPALVTALFVTWNLGFVRLQRGHGAFPDAAPLERLASRQASQTQRLASRALGWIAGPRGSALAYKALVGEYLYYNLMLDGSIELAHVPERFLAGGWSWPRRGASPSFRWALYPRACVRLPLEQPADLRAAILARGPDSIPQQEVSVVLNDALIAKRRLSPDWQELELVLAAERMKPGENLLCLEFAAPARAPGGDPVGAAVSRIQLP